jgi:hypothetical protein
MTPSEVQSRINECLTRAVKILCADSEPQVVRDVVRAYLYTLCRERCRFLRAALHYLHQLHLELPEAGRHSLAELIVQTPARREFEYVDVFGPVADALCCAGRYRTCSKFVAVHPVKSADPLYSDFEPMRIPMRHKPTSPWFRSYKRRCQLKSQLGTRFRSLVGHARSLTKTEFLEQFAARPGEEVAMVDRKGRHYTLRHRMPDVSTYVLLARTGYTPEEFWREVRKPDTVRPHKPQLEFTL